MIAAAAVGRAPTCSRRSVLTLSSCSPSFSPARPRRRAHFTDKQIEAVRGLTRWLSGSRVSWLHSEGGSESDGLQAAAHSFLLSRPPTSCPPDPQLPEAWIPWATAAERAHQSLSDHTASLEAVRGAGPAQVYIRESQTPGGCGWSLYTPLVCPRGRKPRIGGKMAKSHRPGAMGHLSLPCHVLRLRIPNSDLAFQVILKFCLSQKSRTCSI